MPVILYSLDKLISFSLYYGIAVYFKLPELPVVAALLVLESCAYMYATRKHSFKIVLPTR